MLQSCTFVLNVLNGVFNLYDLQHLKRLLNGVLGDNCHRIRPSQKGATVVYLHFLNLRDMKAARECMHNKTIAKYKLAVTVS
jgi:hypothetical protein